MNKDTNAAELFYTAYRNRLTDLRQRHSKPMTYSEKVLFSHLYDCGQQPAFSRGTDYATFRPDRVAMQDATAQMALLQLMNAGQQRVAVPTSVHCDHLIRACRGEKEDLATAYRENKEVYDFLRSAARHFGIDYWKPGAGIIHQVVLENYALPGAMMVGTDSHTPNAGGLGMVAIGVGGADAVDVMTGQPWELRVPRIIGVRLSGSLSPWCAPKDIILTLLGMLTVKGGTNAIIEYFGEGVGTLSATGRATICNMGAELGATCSLFPYDQRTADYLCQTGRQATAMAAQLVAGDLRADDEAICHPEEYYDRVIDINLSDIEPHLNGPFTPDAATPLPRMAEKIASEDYPRTVEVGLIGSCTNSSYQDLCRAAAVAREAYEKGVTPKGRLIVCPGSEQIRLTAERDGIIDDFRRIGAIIMANACGPCIGQWRRDEMPTERRNTIVTSFNRNFRRRADGNPNTFAFIASPELTTALAIAGRLDFDPRTDTLLNNNGKAVMLTPPQGAEAPANGYLKPQTETPADNSDADIIIDPHSQRLQRLEPFAPWDGNDLTDMPLLIKVQGKCTTDHISMAGPWLRFRGHLENISDNLLMGAVNAFNGKSNSVRLVNDYVAVSTAAKAYKEAGRRTVVVAEDNYGEGSSREHAAMEPRFLNVAVVLAKSFARIHETNLKKQGMLALTFADKSDYDRIREDDRLTVSGLQTFTPGVPLTVTLHHADGTTESFAAEHSYNALQIEWFKAGSALNYLTKY